MTKAALQLQCVFLSIALMSLSGCISSSSPSASQFLYTGNTASSTSVSAFGANASSLTALSSSPFTTTANPPITLAVASNKFLYAGTPTQSGVANTGGVMMMSIHADGSLGAAQTFAVGKDYDGIAVTPNGKFLYAVDATSGHVAAYSVDSNTGALTGIGPQTSPAGSPVGPDPFNVRVDPLGKFVFVASCDCTAPHNPPQGAVYVFSINTDGTLTAVPNSPFSLGGTTVPHPMDMAISPDGKFLFVNSLADTPSDNDRVYVESITANGALSSAAAPAQLPTLGSSPTTVVVTPDGKFVYTANAGTGSISLFTVGSNGALTFQRDAGLGGTPGTLLVSPSGDVLYATNFDSNSIVVFSLGSDGMLTQSASVITGGTNPFGLALAQ